MITNDELLEKSNEIREKLRNSSKKNLKVNLCTFKNI